MSMSELEVLAHIDREMLYSFVWGIPAEILAERMRVSVVSIERSCANRGIPFPDEGYWMKVAAGVKPAIPPLTKHRPGPRGTTGTVEDATSNGKAGREDTLEDIDDLLGAGAVDLIVRTTVAETLCLQGSMNAHRAVRNTYPKETPCARGGQQDACRPPS